MQRDSVEGLTPRKLARILRLTTIPDDHDSDSSQREIEGLLRTCLQARPDVARDIAWADLTCPEETRPDAKSRMSLADILTNSRSPLKIVKAIRNCAKTAASRNSADPQYSVAITLYFAAIANGLLSHNAKITTYSYEELQVSFGQLLAKPWMPEKLRILLSQARQTCDRHKQDI